MQVQVLPTWSLSVDILKTFDNIPLEACVIFQTCIVTFPSFLVSTSAKTSALFRRVNVHLNVF
jgi:hypothetical protein